ncbi:MAG: hypothetical protein JWO80_3255 [Bryobacterales bacterium]|nr:hypothetical protein [Bryobacterales bacterium]
MGMVGGFSFAAAGQDSPAQRGVDLAISGRCTEAILLLDQAMRDEHIKTAEKRTVSTAGIRCSMLLNQQNDVMSFLAWLQQQYPRDPEILFLAVHVFSDLSQRNAHELMSSSPESPLVIQLNAESFEKRRDVARAIAEYRILLRQVPDKQGIHYRIGGLLMSQSSMADAPEEAKKEFQEEIKLNPQNASAEFYLGELELQENNLSQAIEHYKRATIIYPGFAEAYGRLGGALLDSGRTADAVAPLEQAVILKPDDPAFHLSLATVYLRSGRKADAEREYALQKSTSEKINQNIKTLRKTVSGEPAAAADPAKQR